MPSGGEILTVGHSTHEEQDFLELVAESAKAIPKAEADDRQEKAEAAEKILAPEGEEKPAGKLWTPGDE